MGIVAAFDRVLFHNETSRFAVLRMKTADMSIPEDARSPYRYHDHLIRFTAVGYDLPQTDAVKVELTGEWKDGKYRRNLSGVPVLDSFSKIPVGKYHFCKRTNEFPNGLQ